MRKFSSHLIIKEAIVVITTTMRPLRLLTLFSENSQIKSFVPFHESCIIPCYEWDWVSVPILPLREVVKLNNLRARKLEDLGVLKWRCERVYIGFQWMVLRNFG